jgi:quinol monooxygenase YgiN
MTQPIVFISHSAIREGQLEAFREFIRTGAAALEADKPGTIVFLAYLDDDASEVSIVHVFLDADAMNAHLQGVEERSREADTFIETKGYEIYGSPDASVRRMMRAFADGSGVPLTVRPEHVGGYVHARVT